MKLIFLKYRVKNVRELFYPIKIIKLLTFYYITDKMFKIKN